MSVTVSISPKDMAKFKRAMRKAMLTEQGKVKKNMKQAGVTAMLGTALKNTPVGTPESTGIKGYAGGRLRSSIHYRPTDNGYAAEIYTNVEYAGFVNYGTRYMKARPFMQKGKKAGIARFVALMIK